LCDRDIVINFGVDAGEVILVDSYAVIVIFCDCYLFCLKKKETEIMLLAVVLYSY
jgi:hypothetical protein